MDEKGFVEGMREYIAQLNREKRYSSAKSYQDALNSFIRYSGTDCIAYSAINKDNLYSRGFLRVWKVSVRSPCLSRIYTV